MSAVAAPPVEVLLVDDDPTDRLVLARLVETTQVGFRLHAVGDGHAALDFLHRRGAYRDAPRPALVLLDLNMPGLHGREVLTRVKAQPDLRAIPIVVLSSSSAATDVQAAYARHANSFIAKPESLEEYELLVRALESYWARTVELGAEDPHARRPGVGAAAAEGADPSALRVLLVEPRAADARFALEALEADPAARYEVVWVSDLAAASRRRVEEVFDVVVADLGLSGRTPFETLSLLVGDAVVPVIGLVDDGVRISDGEVFAAGGHDVLRRDELGPRELARAVRHAGLRFEAARGQQQVRELDRLGRLAGGVAHDFNNLLTVIRSNAELLASGREPPAPIAAEIVDAAERGAHVVAGLARYGRAMPPRLALVDLRAAVFEALEGKLRPRFEGALDIAFEAPSGGPLMAEVDRAGLGEVLESVLDNAADAGTRTPAPVRIGLSSVWVDAREARRGHPEAEPGRYVRLVVTDWGRGVAPEDLPRVFDPFFPSEPGKRRSGLGLAAVQGIMRDHGGWATLGSVRGASTEVTVYFPAR